MKKILKTMPLALIMLFGAVNYGISQPTCPNPSSSMMTQMQRPATQPAMPATLQSRDLGKRTVGDYTIALEAHQAVGSYVWQNNQLVWMPPAANTNLHIETFLRDTRDQKILPYSQVTLQILDQNNNVVDSRPTNFILGPAGYHYGSNFTVPADANYSIRVTATPPQFGRHNRQTGNRLSQPVSVTFPNVRLSPMGQLQE